MPFDRKNKLVTLFLLLTIASSGIAGCNLAVEDLPVSTTSPETKQFEQTIPYAETTIYLQIPESVSEDIVFEMVDDTTGIEMNPTRYVMEKLDDTHYGVRLPVKLGSILKYRFFRNGELPIYETDKYNQMIEYRMAYVNSAVEISDLLVNWSDVQYEYVYGRVEGQVVNNTTNAPLPNLLITAGGIHTFSTSEGKFTLEGLPPGKHNLMIMSTDGEYRIFQQEAVIGEGLTTPAPIRVDASGFVNVTFIVTPPENHTSNAPIRILGNTYQLGNVFASVFNGMSTVASRAPKLSPLPDGTYTTTMSLPIGFDLRYKYSLGDGFWNAELNMDGSFMVRQLIVPDQDLVINDLIQTWNTETTETVTFNLKVPENTPTEDIINIQFKPFGWTAPIPMWKKSNTEWTYILYGPFNMVGSVGYRFCRNGACSLADDASTQGPDAGGYLFTTSPIPQTFEDEVTSWFAWSPSGDPTTLVAPDIKNRDSSFITGAYLASNYNVLEVVYSDQAFQNLVELGSNSVIIPVEWTISSFNPVILSPVPGKNPLWKDLVLWIYKAQEKGLNVWLAPKVEVTNVAMSQWAQGDLASRWQEQFTNAYLSFLTYSADLATYMSVEGVLLPTDVIHLRSFANYEELRTTITEVLPSGLPGLRNHFSGNMYLSLQRPDNIRQELLESFDGYLVMINWPLDGEEQAGSGYLSEFQEKINQNIFPIYENNTKPIIISLDYPSAKGAENGCVQYGEECVEFQLLDRFSSDMQNSVSIDLQTQVDIYQAALAAVNETPWVKGVITYGYNPQVSLQDASSSVRGKPAADVLWYWYPRLTGTQN